MAPELDTSFHDRRLADRMADPEFAGEFEREGRRIAQIDSIVNGIDQLREERGLSKAALARAIDKNPAAIRRLLTASGNPELGTIVALADTLDADVVLVPRKNGSKARGHAIKSADPIAGHAAPNRQAA